MIDMELPGDTSTTIQASPQVSQHQSGLDQQAGNAKPPEQHSETPYSLLQNKLVLPDDEPEDDIEGNENTNFQIDGLSSLVALALEHHLPLLADGITANASAITVRAGSGAFTTVDVSRTSVDISSSGFSWHGEEHLFGRGHPAGKKVAIKRLTKGSDCSLSRSFAAIANEIRIIAHPSLRAHENIVDIIGLGFTGSVHDDPSTDYRWPVLLLDFANCGTLEDFFSLDHIEFTWEIKRNLSYDTILGLEALDDACLLHGDLKLTNVLVFRTEPDNFTAKLCDFGTALISTDYDSDALIHDMVYTPPWDAPEISDGIMVDYFHKVDLYSYGLLVYRIFTEGDDPFEYKRLSKPEFSGVLKQVLVAKWKKQDEVHTICKEAIRQNSQVEFAKDQLDILDAVFDLTIRSDPELRAEEHAQIKSILRPDLSEMEADNRNHFDSYDIMSQIVPRIFSGDLTKSVPSIERCFGSLLPKNIAIEIVDDIKVVANADSSNLEMIETQDRVASAALELSRAYVQGFGFRTSYEEAASWLIHSAELGSRKAQNELVRMFGAMEIPLPPSFGTTVRQMTLDNALSGSPSALEELRLLDSATFDRIKQELRTKYGGMGIDIFGDDIRSAYSLDDPDAFVEKVAHANDKVPFDDEDDGDGLTWLHYAASNGSAAAIHLLTQQDSCNVNCSSEDNKWTPLYMACNGGHFQAAQILLDRGADATKISASGRTCLHYLHAFDPMEISEMAERLLQAGADIEAVDRFGQTPLFTACTLHDGEEAVFAAQSLANYGANPTSRSREGYSPIDISATSLRPDLLRVLLSSRFFTGDGGAELSILSRAKTLKSLMKVPKFHRFRNGGALYQQKLNETLQLLISEEVIKTYVGTTAQKLNPLQDATIWGGTDLIKPLCSLKELDIDAFMDVEDAVNLPPLFEALKFDNDELVKAILDKGASITVSDQAGRNVLHFAVEFAPTMLSFFLSKLTETGRDVKEFLNAGTRERNFTPLDVAILSNRFREAKELISLGAQYKDVTRTGEASELYSTLGLTGGSRRQMSFFLDMPPEQRPSSIVCNYGFTLFHMTAASFDNALLETDPSPADNITFLLEHYFSEADANQPDYAGNTPLHAAALFGNVAVAQTLLEAAGADVNARNIFGSTPLDRLDARKQGKDQAIKEAALVDDLEKRTWERRNDEMERLLQSYGGVRNAQFKRKR